ncbi:MAG: hypothetical protein QW641_02890 [Candidatus Aenigmatarchaeota archaeon]
MVEPQIFHFATFENIINAFFKFKYPELLVFDLDKNLVGFLKARDVIKKFFKYKDIFGFSASFFLSKETEFFFNIDENYLTFFDVMDNYKKYNVSIKKFLVKDVIEFNLDDQIKKVLRKTMKVNAPIVFLENKKPFVSLLPEELFVLAIINIKKLFEKKEVGREEREIKIREIVKKEKIDSVKELIKFNNVISKNYTLSKCISLMLRKKLLTCVTEEGYVLDIKNVYKNLEGES